MTLLGVDGCDDGMMPSKKRFAAVKRQVRTRVTPCLMADRQLINYALRTSYV
jgi:hypothetical protein